jgi:LysM repeat protein
MKTTIFRSSWKVILFAGALVAPAQLSAQRTDSTRAHVVRPGDTLWSLAATYLGDSQRWREILALNSSIRADSLPVGSTIRVPVPGVSRPQPRDTVRRPTVPDSIVTVRPATAPDTTRRTIFYGVRPAGGFARLDSGPPEPVDSGVPARVYEAVSAPFVTDEATLDNGGRCVSVGPAAAAEAGGVLLQGSLSIRLPAGAAADTGSRWLLVRRGPLLAGLGSVAIPTGVVRLTSAGGSGSPRTAQVVAQYDAMSCTDVILPAVVPPATPRGDRLTPVTDGASGRVAWVASQSALATLQHALILDIGAASGARPGDRVTVYDGNGSVVASADIVRVERRSSTALVVHQSLGSLAAGLRVRVTEKLP